VDLPEEFLAILFVISRMGDEWMQEAKQEIAAAHGTGISRPAKGLSTST